MKIVIPIIIVAAIILVVAAIIAVSVVSKKQRIAEENAEKIIGCSYYNGGGMEGSSTRLEIYINEKGVTEISYSDIDYNGAEEKTVTKEVPFEALEKIREVCKKRQILSWGELSYSKMQVLDAPTTTICITYGENETYSFSSNKDIPLKKGKGVYSEIYNLLKSYL